MNVLENCVHIFFYFTYLKGVIHNDAYSTLKSNENT